MQGTLGSWGQAEFARPRWQIGKSPRVIVLSRLSHFPKRAWHRCCRRLCSSCPSCLPLHGHLGELVSPAAAPHPHFLPHSWPDGGGADIRGKGEKSAQEKFPTQTFRVSGRLGKKLWRKDCFAPCVCITAENRKVELGWDWFKLPQEAEKR